MWGTRNCSCSHNYQSHPPQRTLPFHLHPITKYLKIQSNILIFHTIASKRKVWPNIRFLLQLNGTIHTNLHCGWPYAGNFSFIYSHAFAGTAFPLTCGWTGIQTGLRIQFVDGIFIFNTFLPVSVQARTAWLLSPCSSEQLLPAWLPFSDWDIQTVVTRLYGAGDVSSWCWAGSGNMDATLLPVLWNYISLSVNNSLINLLRSI